MRDENGFKQHTMSEGHVRSMQVVGANAKSFIHDYSQQFKRDFVQLLRTSHGEKWVHANHFYQEYIGNKEHVHMNSTQWPSLTEFTKYLGREGICRVKEEEEKGLFIAWVDDSPEALRRTEALKNKEKSDRGDEHREQKLLQQQIERARAQAKAVEEAQEARRKEKEDAAQEAHDKATEPTEAEPIKFDFGVKKSDASTSQALNDTASGTGTPTETEAKPAPIKIGFGAPKPKNVFAEEKKKNPFKAKKMAVEEPPKKMSEAERIMKEEMEKKRKFTDRNGTNGEQKKRMRL